MNDQQKYVWLVNQRTQAGATLHRRLVITRELLGSKEWVDDPSGGGGDEFKAMDRLEDQCFGDCGMDLVQMLDLLRAVPEERVWARNKHNLRRMYAEKVLRREAEKPKRERKPQEADARDRLIAKLQARIAEQDEEIARLREENRAMSKTLKRLQALLGGIGEVG